MFMNMRVKKIGMSGLLCLTSVLIGLAFVGKAATVSAATWEQTEFAIGAWNGVRLTGNEAEDKSRLNDVAAAGFNILVGQNTYYSSCRFADTGIGPENENAVSIKYELELLNDINSSGQKLRLIAKDYGLLELGSNGWTAPVNREYTNEFSNYDNNSSLKDSLFGYLLYDEPSHEQLKTFEEALTSAQNLQSDKLSYINLGNPRLLEDVELPSSAPADVSRTKGQDLSSGTYFFYYPDGESMYREYCKTLAQYGQVLSFDYYQWASLTGDFTRNIEPDYFLKAKVIAQEAKNAGKPWWGIPLCSEHESRKSDTSWDRGFVQHDTSNPSNVELEKAVLRFNAYSNLVYGAKGVMWYTYDTENNPIRNPQRVEPFKIQDGPDYYHENCLDWDGNKTYKYDIVADINNTISKMGPTLMDLTWLETIHGDSLNNYGKFPDPKAALPTVNDRTPVLSSVQENDTLAVGIFEGKDNKNYLMILNKDVDEYNVYKLGLKSSKLAYKFNKNTGSFETYSYGDTLGILVKPGDIELIKLEDLSPNLTSGKSVTANDYFGYESPDKAVDGNANTLSDKWCSRLGAGSFLTVDLGEERLIGSYMVVHGKGTYAEWYSPYCTRSFRLQGSSDGENWYDANVVVDNNENVTLRSVYPFSARYLRLYIDSPDRDNVTRIYEFQAFGLESFPWWR